jgi:hypothetical protein
MTRCLAPPVVVDRECHQKCQEGDGGTGFCRRFRFRILHPLLSSGTTCVHLGPLGLWGVLGLPTFGFSMLWVFWCPRAPNWTFRTSGGNHALALFDSFRNFWTFVASGREGSSGCCVGFVVGFFGSPGSLLDYFTSTRQLRATCWPLGKTRMSAAMRWPSELERRWVCTCLSGVLR